MIIKKIEVGILEGLSRRAKEAIREIDSLGSLLEFSADDLFEKGGVGPGVIREIRLALWRDGKKMLRGDHVLAMIGKVDNAAVIGIVEDI